MSEHPPDVPEVLIRRLRVRATEPDDRMAEVAEPALVTGHRLLPIEGCDHDPR